MKSSQRSVGARAALAAGALALVLSACGEEPKPEPKAAEPEPAKPAPAPVAKPAPAAPAQPQGKEMSENWKERFRQADANKDGGLSRSELRKIDAFKGMEANFDSMDANRDGKVTIAEREAWGNRKRR